MKSWDGISSRIVLRLNQCRQGLSAFLCWIVEHPRALCYIKTSLFFPFQFRNALSDFGVVIAIIVMTALSHMIGLDVPSLHVPESFTPTLDRPWLIDITHTPAVAALVSFFPAAFYTILIVMDQQITAVIINRKDNMLRKGEGYHLDLLIIAVLVLICSFLGLPFYVAATVLSVMHVNSLRIQSESSAPGEIPRFLGVKEQRLTGFFAHLLIGLSVFLTGVIKVGVVVLTKFVDSHSGWYVIRGN
ncbi:HCO3- transporter family protein [Ancylostoma caninum]|uniref:HCO3-transporter family protein n=1 Tax=Ancylostoma caninum TaxID=29170 RepID=A0A368GCT3_ANCCA|nr:HCO3- transporter family protein [Ancylostoma caninum]